MVSKERLRELLSYDEKTGVFKWKVRRGNRKEGAAAGASDKGGYIVIRIDTQLYKAHRLAWLYTYGEWPVNGLDHINQITSDNRICNLRDVSHSENMLNMSLHKKNTSGANGVVWDKSRSKWRAQIKVDYKFRCIGRFEHKADAIAARREAETSVMHRYGKG